VKPYLKYLPKKLLLIVLIGFLVFQYLKSDFNTAFDDKGIQELQSDIENATPVPTDFAKNYTAVFSTSQTNTYLFAGLFSNEKRDCPCLNVARMSRVRGDHVFTGNEYVLAWKLEKQFSQEQCLAYWLQKLDFLYNTRGIDEAAAYYFQKELTDLSDLEQFTLIIMTANPDLYNPIRQLESLNSRLVEVLRKIAINKQ